MGPWAMPAGCRALEKAAGAGSEESKAAPGKGGGKKGAARPKAAPKKGAKPKPTHGRERGSSGADPSGLLAAVQTFSTVKSFLRSLGLTGKCKGRSSGGGGASAKQPQRKQQ